jgi:inosose dehydratase
MLLLITTYIIPQMKRRSFLQTAAGAAVGFSAAALEKSFGESTSDVLHIAVNEFTANNLYGRDHKNYRDHLAELKTVGASGLELMVSTAASLEKQAKQFQDNGLELRSVYTGGNFFDEKRVRAETDRFVKLGEAAKKFGTKIIVFNADPKTGKSDAELELQSQSIDKAGAELAKIGITLALHYHTTELEFGGREFHHLLCGTDPKHLSLCLEEHWSYRACGNSQVALFDHFKLYKARIVEVHLRQSVKGIWSETFGDGDIDNIKLAAALKTLPVYPHVVVEQCAENGTPQTIEAGEVFKQSFAYIRKIFG